jgi:hypothetical protein
VDRPPPRLSAAQTRVVLLGASNLTLYLPRVLAIARAAHAGPLDVLGAAGLGRSFGAWSRMLRRELPGVLECGLWAALERAGDAPPLPLEALVIDVGNDLAYGVPAERVAGWIATCLDRLAAHGARTILTLLPLSSLERLGRARFAAARTILFPGHEVCLEEVRAAARELQERLSALAAERGVRTVEPPASWYALDPIHLPPWRAREAWGTILGAWGAPGAPRLDAADRRRVRRARPALARVGGAERVRPQPAARLADGTTLSMY